MSKLYSTLTLAAAIFALSSSGALAGDAAAGKAKAAMCAGCHGAAGVSAVAMWPNLAGQGATYLERQLQAFKGAKMRNNAQMAPMVAALSDADMKNLGAYFASLPAGTNKARGDIEVGEQLYRGGDAEREIPACMSCHGPAGKGMAAAAYPAVAGQHADYSASQLKAFASGERTSDPSGMMRTIASRLTEAEMRSVAEFMAGLR